MALSLFLCFALVASVASQGYQTCTRALDVVFVIDSSASIKASNPPGGYPDNWDLVKSFTSDFVNRFDVGPNAARFGTVVYGDRAVSKFYLNQHYDKYYLTNALNNLEYLNQNTNTSGGIHEMRTVQFKEYNGDRKSIQNVAIVITDGEATHDRDLTISSAQMAHKEGIVVFTVGVTNNVNVQEISGISSPPHQLGTNYFMAMDFNSLASIIDSIVLQVCQAKVAVKPIVVHPQLVGHKVDLVVVMDSSGSIKDSNPYDQSYDNWQLLLEFIANIVKQLDIGQNLARVGFVDFSQSAQNVFYLTTYTTKTDLVRAIMDVPYLNSWTNITGAIQTMHLEQFAYGRGDRDGVNNVALVIVDGAGNVDEYNTAAAAMRAKDAGIRIMVVAITNMVDKTEVIEMASEPKKKKVPTATLR